MFDKILIANRGEIACRIMRTASRLGVATVAVYSEADANARHVAMADEAYAIGPAPARQSYLRGDIILDVARRSGAQGVHPGYGFLSENADFAQACADAGVVFIGPPPAAIRAMGSKAAAKELMAKSGVPLVPGYHGADQSAATLQAQARLIGYPVLLKASAGGGGRGMRVVTAEADLAEAIERAQGEARASFGDDHLLIERYLTRPRHIEVQVFGDTHGTIVSLFERDCSIQRRHQKVLEESPAPGLSVAQRDALGDAAIAAARAVDYVGAGTVEFIYEDDRFYFMEMNTRLQVEHPVTEFVTGQDLVEWQLRVACGEALPATQMQLALRGHAIEARICAEDPERDFSPATGCVTYLRQPEPGPHVRVDTGISEGDTITAYYDSMIAKLIVWDEDRTSALRRMARALDDYRLIGPHTNLDLLRGIVGHRDFADADFDTGFIARHPELLATKPQPSAAIWAAAALAALEPHTGRPADPWDVRDGWRSNGDAKTDILLSCGEVVTTIRAESSDAGFWRLHVPTGAVVARLRGGADAAALEMDGALLALSIVRRGAALTVIQQGRNHDFTVIDRLAAPEAEAVGDARMTAATPARVVSVFVAAGSAVILGQKLLILEAMKVETTFSAPRDGVVETVYVRVDDMVQEGAELVSFRPPEAP